MIDEQNQHWAKMRAVLGAVMFDPKITRCTACKAPIFFALSSAGRRLPIDAEPVDTGNVIIDGQERDPRNGELMPKAIVLGKADTPLGDPVRFVSHFSTCPNAGQFRR